MRRLFRLSRPARDVSRDLSSELQFHLEMRTQELVAGGLSPEAARSAALRAFGDLAQVERECRDISERRVRARERQDYMRGLVQDLRFAFRVAKHVKSNTIVYAKDRATVGIGAGQMSRIDSARIAARKAQDAAKELGLAQPLTKGSVVASDAFFPFADGLLVAIEAGATAVIQPGGSMRDDEVIKAADDAGIAMVFTGTRHFRH